MLHGHLSLVAAVLVVGLVVVVDVGAWTWAAARARTAADGAALAAVVDGDDPRDAAREVALLSGGDLVACTCEVGAREAEVAVRFPVGGLVLHRVWATHVEASARAVARRRPPDVRWRLPAGTDGPRTPPAPDVRGTGAPASPP